MIWKHLFLLFLFICSCTVAVAQKELLEQGDLYFENEKFNDAAVIYAAFLEGEDNVEILYKKGICHLHLNEVDQAGSIFLQLKEKNVEIDGIDLNLATYFHQKEQYKNAIASYKNYLRTIKRDHPDRRMVVARIKRCANGLKMDYQTELAFVENYGNKINSPHHDFGAVQSPNFLNRYYFSSNREESTGGLRDAKGLRDDVYGNYYSDMYTMEMNAGIWTLVNVLDPLINSSQHDIIYGFSEDGNSMYFGKGLDIKAMDLHTHDFISGDNLKFPEKYKSKFVGKNGDIDIQVYNDSTFVFSTKRIRGEGGADIYVMRKIGDQWLEPKNISRTINSPFDEISPFLTRDGRKIFFSSNRLESIGGYDIFYSEYNSKTKEWSEPLSANAPINSPGDDTHFRLSHDGLRAVFSSNRIGGYGGHDLYIAYLKDQEKKMLLGQSKLNYLFPPSFVSQEVAIQDSIQNAKFVAEAEEDEKEDVKIRKFIISPLTYTDENDVISPQNTQKLDFLVEMMTIYPQLTLELQGHTSDEGITAYELYFSLKRAEKVMEYLVDNGVNKKRITLKGLGNNYPKVKDIIATGSVNMAEKLNKRIEIVVHNYDGLPLQIKYDEVKIADYLKDERITIFAETTAGLSYKVQVAVANQLYTNDVLSFYPDAMIEKDIENNEYNYTVGLFSDYISAKNLKDKLIRNNFPNAEIIPFINGERISKSEIYDATSVYADLLTFIKYEQL